MTQVLFLQTSDPIRYADMLAATSRTVRAYCNRHGYDYESYLGVKRGNTPWHACFNRCYMLNDLLTLGYRGWAVYLDADAYIADQSFDLDAFFKEHADKAGVMVVSEAGQRKWWDVNSGVVMLNFNHPVAVDIVQRWKGMIDAVSTNVLHAHDNFNPVIGDQLFLQTVLRGMSDAADMIYNAPSTLINSPKASFIRQCLRGVEKNLTRRIALIRNEVDAVMGSSKPDHETLADVEEDVARAMTKMLYETLLDRTADHRGLRDFPPIIRRKGPVEGARFLVNELIKSAEFGNRLEKMLTNRRAAAEAG